MAAKTHTILIAGGSGLVGHAAIKFAIAAGHFVIALVRRGGSPSVEGLASEETLKIIEVDFDALDQYQPEISALAPNALICALGTTIRKAGSKDAPSIGWGIVHLSPNCCISPAAASVTALAECRVSGRHCLSAENPAPFLRPSARE